MMQTIYVIYNLKNIYHVLKPLKLKSKLVQTLQKKSSLRQTEFLVYLKLTLVSMTNLSEWQPCDNPKLRLEIEQLIANLFFSKL